MKYETKCSAPDLRAFSLEKLIALWEETSKAPMSPELPMVRGWLMDEIERREPDGFNAWLNQDAPDDSDLWMYILGLPF